jgi:hypothetical protein
MKKLLTLLLAVLLLAGCAGNKPGTFEAGKNTFLLNGKPFVVKAAEVHYPRIPREYWEHRIEMCKALGMNTLCLYVFWNLHEETPGKYDFTGNKDAFFRFQTIAQLRLRQAGIDSQLRCGKVCDLDNIRHKEVLLWKSFFLILTQPVRECKVRAGHGPYFRRWQSAGIHMPDM